MRENASRKVIAVSIAVAVAVSAVFLFWRSQRAPMVTYREVSVERGDMDVSVVATGTVQPENRLELKAPIAGRIERVLAKEGQKAARGQILAWMSSTERAALLDAARAKGEEELKRWEEMYRPTPVLAPIAGTVISRNVEPGQTITATDAIFVMSDRLTVKAQVDETDIARVKLKQKASIVLDAYADKRVDAEVDQIAFEAKTVNNVTTYLVDVLPQSTPEFMRSGMTANVTFVVEARKGVVWVPADAVRVRERDGKTVVAVKSPSGPSDREVEIGATDGKRTEVTSGVSEGEVLLIASGRPRDRNRAGNSPFSPLGSGGNRRGGGR